MTHVGLQPPGACLKATISASRASGSTEPAQVRSQRQSHVQIQVLSHIRGVKPQHSSQRRETHGVGARTDNFPERPWAWAGGESDACAATEREVTTANGQCWRPERQGTAQANGFTECLGRRPSWVNRNRKSLASTLHFCLAVQKVRRCLAAQAIALSITELTVTFSTPPANQSFVILRL